MIEAISVEDVNMMLQKIGLHLGSWNEVVDQPDGQSPGVVSFAAPEVAIELYVCAQNVSTWLAGKPRLLFQLDNSTFPSADEVEIFRALGVWSPPLWEPSDQRSLLIQAEGSGTGSAVPLFIFFSLLFKWHVYLVAEGCSDRERLGLLDGSIHFFGGAAGLERARSLVRMMAENKLVMK